MNAAQYSFAVDSELNSLPRIATVRWLSSGYVCEYSFLALSLVYVLEAVVYSARLVQWPRHRAALDCR